MSKKIEQLNEEVIVINPIVRSVTAGVARAEDAKRLGQVYELMCQIAKSRVVYGHSANHRTAQCARQAVPMGQTSSLN